MIVFRHGPVSPLAEERCSGQKPYRPCQKTSSPERLLVTKNGDSVNRIEAKKKPRLHAGGVEKLGCHRMNAVLDLEPLLLDDDQRS